MLNRRISGPNHRVLCSSPNMRRARPPSTRLATLTTRNTKRWSTSLRPQFGTRCYPGSISASSSYFSGFQKYPTYDLLAAYGITPSNKTTYPLANIQDALKAQTGAVPYLGCSVKETSLSEVWYFGHVYGTVSVGSAPHRLLLSDCSKRSNLATLSRSTRPPSRTVRLMFITTRGVPRANTKFARGRLSLVRYAVLDNLCTLHHIAQSRRVHQTRDDVCNPFRKYL